MSLTPEEFLAALAAVHRYMREIEKPLDIEEGPRIWKIAERLGR